MASRRRRFVPALVLLAACASPPEPDCSRRMADGSLAIDCAETPDARWGEQAVDEAEEGFDERAPGGRR